MNPPDDYLLMSGIQHFCFCRRQWGLIHLEQQWQENQRTAEGRLDHARCHDDGLTEKRGDLLIIRGMRVISHHLKLTGTCDVVEFHTDATGVPLQSHKGLWLPMPIEYKHGAPKESDADRLQLCAQAIALEEMLVCQIEQGAMSPPTRVAWIETIPLAGPVCLRRSPPTRVAWMAEQLLALCRHYESLSRSNGCRLLD